jgi:hypothetical protein
MSFGASVTLTEMNHTLAALAAAAEKSRDPVVLHRKELLDAFATQLKWFSSTRMRCSLALSRFPFDLW